MTQFTRRRAFIGAFSVAAVGPIAGRGPGMRRVLADHGAAHSASPEASPMAGEMGMGMGGTGAAYMVITNAGAESDHLIGGSTSVTEVVEIHEIVDNAGVMEMRPLAEGLEIPANGTVVLEPGGYHVMLIGLTEDLVADMTFDLRLRFEQAGEVTVPVVVQRSAPKGDEIQTTQVGDLTISGVWSRPAPALRDEMGTPEASPVA